MISIEQITKLSSQFKIDESVVAREFVQLLLLNDLYSNAFSKNLFFKGGTAIRLVYNGSRFSEDLDFTVNYDEKDFLNDIKKFFNILEKEHNLKVKEKRSVLGRTYLITAKVPNFKTDIFIKLDFSFREIVIEPIVKQVETSYPIVFTSFINTLSLDEIIAEKVRAIMTRSKQRDLYDFWILTSLGGKFRLDLVNKKLSFYNEKFIKEDFLKKVESFNEKDFIRDLRPFIPINQREKLTTLQSNIKNIIRQTVL